jgi:hypothetical protein
MDEPLERLAAEMLSDPHARALIAEAARLGGGDRDAAVRLIVLRLRQGHPRDDALRAAVGRAGRILERGRRGD